MNKYKKHNIISVILFFIIVLFGLNYGVKKNIKWNKNIITWENFIEVNTLENEYVADILSSIKYKNTFEDPDFEIFAYMDQNNSHKVKDSIDNQVLIHEKYHFNITEYHARLLRKEIIGIGRKSINEYKMNKALNKYLKLCNKMQDEYDNQSDHNRKREKQRFWELKIDDLLRQTEIYSNTKLNTYHLYNPKKTNYFKKISLNFKDTILTSHPVNPENKNLGEIYQFLKYKDSSVIKYFKNGKNINGGYFNTAIFKLIYNTSTIKKYYLNKNRTLNKKLDFQIEKKIFNQNGQVIIEFYKEGLNTLYKKHIWQSLKDDDIYTGTFYNKKGEKTYNEKGIFKIRKTLDSIGRVSKVEYLNKEGELMLEKESFISGAIFFYNTNHTIKQKKLINTYGGYALHKNIYNKTYDYDDLGNISKITSLDTNNNRTEDKSGISIYKYWYDLKSNEIQAKRYNKKDIPVLGSEDYFKEVNDYDLKNRIVFNAKYYFLNTLKFNEDDKWGATKYEYINDSIELRYNLDGYNINFNDDTGVATVKCYLDKNKNIFKAQYLDSNGNFAKTKDNVVQYINKYDNHNNIIEETTLDSLNNKISFSEDVSTVKWEYNKNNIKTKTTYFTTEGKLANARQNATYNFFTVNNKNQIEEIRYYTKEMKPVEIDGIFKTKYLLNRFGKDSIVEYYNKRNKLINGVAIIKYEYNKYGTLIHEFYFNSERKRTKDSNNISYKLHLVNLKQQSIGYKFFNEKNFRSKINNKYYHEKITLDNYGYIISYEYFNRNGKPTLNLDGYHKIIYERDSLGEMLGYKQLDTNNKLVEDKNGIAKYKYSRFRSGLESSAKSYDKNGCLVNDKNGVAETYYLPYLNGLYYIEKEIDKNGKVIKKENE